MRSSQRVIVALILVIAVLGVGWLRLLQLDAVPTSWVGIWENETSLFGAGSGEVRLVVSREGLTDLQFDHQKYDWWGPDQLHIRGCGDIAEVWSEPNRRIKMRVEVLQDRMTVSDPDHPHRPGDVIEFRRAPVP